MAIINVTAEADNSTKTYIKTGNHSIIIDEPPMFGGEDTAPSPVAMFLASLAGCINAIGQWVAKEMNFTVKKLYINIDGEVDSTAFFTGNFENRAGFSEINVTITLNADITEEQREVWLKNVIERCPVTDNIKNMTCVDFYLKCD
ncbi:MAG: OsmC family protein [Candidatus Metalachnospira sp.]|nr:OsmC family protein [Candidatus Metalachnospira sp.]